MRTSAKNPTLNALRRLLAGPSTSARRGLLAGPSRSALLTIMLALGAVACAPNAVELDGENDSVIGSERGDTAGYVDGTVEACRILAAANSASAEELRDARVHEIVIAGLMDRRLGDDGVAGTDDDGGFKNLLDVDLLSHVGPIAFRALARVETTATASCLTSDGGVSDAGVPDANLPDANPTDAGSRSCRTASAELPESALGLCNIYTAPRVRACGADTSCDVAALMSDNTPSVIVPGYGSMNCFTCVAAEVTQCLRSACSDEVNALECCLLDNGCFLAGGGIDTACSTQHCGMQNTAYEACGTCQPSGVGGEFVCGAGVLAGCGVGNSTVHSPRCFAR